MNTDDPVVARLLTMIQRIIEAEVWRESVKRGRAVDRRDPVVQERACEAILQRGQQMREEATRLAYGRLPSRRIRSAAGS